MLLLKFDLDDIEKCKTLEDVFEMMGVGLSDKSEKDLNINNKEVFGAKAYYANMVMSDATYNRIYEHLKPLGKKWYNRNGGRMPSAAALQWTNYSPISSGPRFEAVKERVGEINDSVLYIITPEDDLYEEEPTVRMEKEDEQGSSNS